MKAYNRSREWKILTHDKESRAKFVEKFNWNDPAVNQYKKQKMQNLLAKYHSIFARHRLDLGKNTDYLIKLIHECTRPVYTLKFLEPVHLRDQLPIELVLMQYFEIKTTLPFSKYSSPIFAQRKTSGKLRFLIDLCRILHLLKDVYTNNNSPIPTMTDAIAHLTGKKIFAKMDCSQANFSMQMADEFSIQFLAFNYGAFNVCI